MGFGQVQFTRYDDEASIFSVDIDAVINLFERAIGCAHRWLCGNAEEEEEVGGASSVKNELRRNGFYGYH